MANSLAKLIAKTRVMAGISGLHDLNDGQLLDQFIHGNEMAFTALVARHGGLVMGVSRRILQHTQDAEDAFQATFLVLARKAGKMIWNESIANWLHGVAYHMACQVRRARARHQSRQPLGDDCAVASPDPSWSELKPVLDEELNRLPVKYRIPLILCCLEGKSRDEAAAQLRWSLGSVKGRLERGREMLRTRLAKRGMTLSAALAATFINPAGAKAIVPAAVGMETVRAGMAMLAGNTAVVSARIVTLTQGALHMMFMTKLKFAAAIMSAVIVLGLGTGYGIHLAFASGSEKAKHGLGVEPVAQNEESKMPSTDDAPKNKTEPAPIEKASLDKLIDDLDSADGQVRIAATKEIFRRGAPVLPGLKKAGAKQIAPFGPMVDVDKDGRQFCHTPRLDMVYSLLEGLPPNKTLSGYGTDQFAINAIKGTTRKEIEEMGKACGFSIKDEPLAFKANGNPTCYVSLGKGKTLAGVLKRVLTEEPKVTTLNLYY